MSIPDIIIIYRICRMYVTSVAGATGRSTLCQDQSPGQTLVQLLIIKAGFLGMEREVWVHVINNFSNLDSFERIILVHGNW